MKTKPLSEETQRSIDKLNASIEGLEREIPEIYAAIGEIYVRRHSNDNTDPEIGAQLDRLTVIDGEKMALAKQIKALSGIMTCPSCGQEIASDSFFCMFCGCNIKSEQDILGGGEQDNYCPYCGAETEPGQRFCMQCGHRLTAEAPAPAKMIPQPPLTPAWEEDDGPTLRGGQTAAGGGEALPPEEVSMAAPEMPAGADLPGVDFPVETADIVPEDEDDAGTFDDSVSERDFYRAAVSDDPEAAPETASAAEDHPQGYEPDDDPEDGGTVLLSDTGAGSEAAPETASAAEDYSQDYEPDDDLEDEGTVLLSPDMNLAAARASARQQETRPCCPVCGTVIESDAFTFCLNCGTRLNQAPAREESPKVTAFVRPSAAAPAEPAPAVKKECPKCHTPLDDDLAGFTFCIYCGAPLK